MTLRAPVAPPSPALLPPPQHPAAYNASWLPAAPLLVATLLLGGCNTPPMMPRSPSAAEMDEHLEVRVASADLATTAAAVEYATTKMGLGTMPDQLHPEYTSVWRQWTDQGEATAATIGNVAFVSAAIGMQILGGGSGVPPLIFGEHPGEYDLRGTICIEPVPATAQTPAAPPRTQIRTLFILNASCSMTAPLYERFWAHITEKVPLSSPPPATAINPPKQQPAH